MDNISESDETKYQLCNIFKFDNRTICLLCMDDVSCNTNSLICNNETLASHLQSEVHKKKIKSLLRECFPDPSFDNQEKKNLDFINSLIFDISLYLGNEPSYVSQVGYNVICIMCSKTLFQANETTTADIMLFDHLKSEQHINNVKNWACWIYFFDSDTGFIMISQSTVYCSSCKKTIVMKRNRLLLDLEYHLNNKHNQHLRRSAKPVKVSNDKYNELDDYPEKHSDTATNYDNVFSKLDRHPLEIRSEVAQENSQLQCEYDQYLLKPTKDIKESNLVDEYDHCVLGSLENQMENVCLESRYDQYSLRRLEDRKDCNPLENENDHHSLEYPENVKSDPENKNDVQLQGSAEDVKENNFEYNVDYYTLEINDKSLTKNHDHLENEFGSRPFMIVGDVKNNVRNMESALYTLDTSSTHGKNSGGNVKENCGPDFDNESTDTEDFVDALEALTCPVCGDFVEIINENAEFSLQLHCQKHKDLDSVNTDNELSFNENVEYVCPICHDVIPIFNKNIELSVRHHFEERKNDHEGFGFTNNDKSDLLANTFSNFPEPLKKYKNFLCMEENNIFCKLCNCAVPLGNGDGNVSKILHDHLSDSFHEVQYRSLSQNLAMVVVDCNKQNSSHQPNEQLDLFEKLVKKHPSIKENRQFIEKKSVHYFCQLCQKHIAYSSNENTLALNFMFHLRGPGHTQAFRALEKSTSEKCLVQQPKKDKGLKKQLKRTMTTTMFEIANRSAEVYLNQNYFKIKMGKVSFHCVICKEPFEFSERCSKLLISHCNSSGHNEILTKYSKDFVSNLRLSSRQYPSTELLKNVLDSIASCEFLRPHIQFMLGDGQGCRCVLCDVKIPTTKKNIQEHIFGNNHKDNAFKIICQIQHEVNKKIYPVKVEDPIQLAKKVLASLLEYSPIVGMNSQFIDVKNQHFFCKICCETIEYSKSGNHLKTHLNSVRHKKMMSRAE